MASSSLARAALLPTGGARRLGSGRVPPAALPGHGAAVLAGRRDWWTGLGGVLAAKLQAPPRDVKAVCAKTGIDPEGDEDPEGDAKPEGDTDDLKEMDNAQSDKSDMMLGMFLPLPAPVTREEKAVHDKFMEIAERCIDLIDLCARDAKAASDPDPDTTVKPGYGDWEEIDKKRMQEFDRIYIEFIQKVDLLHARGELLDGLPLPPAPAAVSDKGKAVSDEEKAVQEQKKALQKKLVEIAERCINLQADTMRRLSLKQKLQAYNFFWPVLLGFKMVAAAAKDERCSWGLAMLIRVNLDAVRKMVSHACDTPLHLPWVVFTPRVDLKDRLPEDNWAAPYVSVFGWRFTGIHSCEEAMLELLQDLYLNVRTDIDNIINAAA